MRNRTTEILIADLLKILGVPFRIKLLYTIGSGEACVCHLEALSNKRQAYISQHLMVMRDAGLLSTRRDGKYIYYRVANPEIFALLDKVSDFVGIAPEKMLVIAPEKKFSSCVCPKCEREDPIPIAAQIAPRSSEENK